MKKERIEENCKTTFYLYFINNNLFPNKFFFEDCVSETQFLITICCLPDLKNYLEFSMNFIDL